MRQQFKLPGPWFNIKMSSYQYRKFHCGDKMVVRSSYLHNGISYIGKMVSFYWIRALVFSLSSDANQTCLLTLKSFDNSAGKELNLVLKYWYFQNIGQYHGCYGMLLKINLTRVKIGVAIPNVMRRFVFLCVPQGCHRQSSVQPPVYLAGGAYQPHRPGRGEGPPHNLHCHPRYLRLRGMKRNLWY